MTAIADIVMTFMNSARKKIANRMPGVLGVEPADELLLGLDEVERRVVRLGDRRDQEDDERRRSRASQYQSVKIDCQPSHACSSTMPRVESVPAWISTPTIASPNAAS